MHRIQGVFVSRLAAALALTVAACDVPDPSDDDTGPSDEDTGPREVVAGDLTGDEVPDFVLLTRSTEPGVGAPAGSVLLYSGDRAISGLTFENADQVASSPSGYALAMCDPNGDGYTDLVVGDEEIRVWYGTPTGIHLADAPWTIDFAYAGAERSLACADLDGDGVDDLVVEGAVMSIVVVKGQSDLAEQDIDLFAGDPAILATLDDLWIASFLTADVDGDGVSDLVVGAPSMTDVVGNLHVFLGGPGLPSAASGVADLVLTSGWLDVWEFDTFELAQVGGHTYALTFGRSGLRAHDLTASLSGTAAPPVVLAADVDLAEDLVAVRDGARGHVVAIGGYQPLTITSFSADAPLTDPSGATTTTPAIGSTLGNQWSWEEFAHPLVIGERAVIAAGLDHGPVLLLGVQDLEDPVLVPIPNGLTLPTETVLAAAVSRRP